VLSLLYVAAQIRQNTRVSPSSARHAIPDSAASITSDILATSDVADLLRRDIAGEDLAEAEVLKLYARAYMIMRTWDNIFYQYRLGMLAEDEWRGFRRNLSVNLHTRHVREYWHLQGDMFSDAFRSEVEQILAEIEDHPDEPMVEGLIKRPGHAGALTRDRGSR